MSSVSSGTPSTGTNLHHHKHLILVTLIWCHNLLHHTLKAKRPAMRLEKRNMWEKKKPHYRVTLPHFLLLWAPGQILLFWLGSAIDDTHIRWRPGLLPPHFSTTVQVIEPSCNGQYNKTSCFGYFLFRIALQSHQVQPFGIVCSWIVLESLTSSLCPGLPSTWN